jgi:acetamidase/formamidase
MTDDKSRVRAESCNRFAVHPTGSWAEPRNRFAARQGFRQPSFVIVICHLSWLHSSLMAEFTLTAASTHSRWNRDLAPQLSVGSAAVVHFQCLDSSGGQVGPESTLNDFLQIDRNKIHTLTGPVFVEDAQPGDVLGIEFLEIAHQGWGWSSIFPNLGFLPQQFPEPFFFIWTLEKNVSRSLAPAIVPLRPFCGVVGLAPDEEGEFRTRCPGVFGGNIDVRDLGVGSTLYLPVQTTGALLSVGDAHAAQGDGEVCINGIECPADVTVRLKLLKNKKLGAPFVESAPSPGETAGKWIMVESDADPLAAARRATLRMIEFLGERWGLSPEHAYLLCSVAMDLRFAQVVNVPMVTVCAALEKSVLEAR